MPQTADRVTQVIIVPQQPSLPPTALRTSPNPCVEAQRAGEEAYLFFPQLAWCTATRAGKAFGVHLEQGSNPLKATFF